MLILLPSSVAGPARGGDHAPLHKRYCKGNMDVRDMRANFDAMDLYNAGRWSTMMRDGAPDTRAAARHHRDSANLGFAHSNRTFLPKS